MSRERVTLTASQRLLEVLSKIKHAISSSIIEDVRYHGGSIVSYLDICESNDFISFIYSNKMDELQRECNNDELTFKEKVWTSKRAEMKVGKLVRLMYGSRFPINHPKGKDKPDIPYDIESFVNMFKAEMANTGDYEKFDIVEGEDIVFWYNQENYSKFCNEETTLGKSCLRYEESSKYLELYLKNSDKIKMVIFKDSDNKLKGRAILWTLDKPERTFMDRIYTVNDFDVEVFKNYAKKNEWLFKERQTFGWNNRIIDGKDDTIYNPSDLIMTTELKHDELRYYPYLDTMCVYNKDIKVVTNDGTLLIKPPHIHLIDYQGNYYDESEYREMIYSKYYGNEIVKENATYCEIDDDWVYSNDSVYVFNSNNQHAIITSNKVVQSRICGNKKYFLKDDCIYSTYLDTWFYNKSIMTAYTNRVKSEKIIIHKNMAKYFLEENNELFLKPIGSYSVNEQANMKDQFGSYKNYIIELLLNGDSFQYVENNDRLRRLIDNGFTVNMPHGLYGSIDPSYSDIRHPSSTNSEEEIVLPSEPSNIVNRDIFDFNVDEALDDYNMSDEDVDDDMDRGRCIRREPSVSLRRDPSVMSISEPEITTNERYRLNDAMVMNSASLSDDNGTNTVSVSSRQIYNEPDNNHADLITSLSDDNGSNTVSDDNETDISIDPPEVNDHVSSYINMYNDYIGRVETVRRRRRRGISDNELDSNEDTTNSGDPLL